MGGLEVVTNIIIEKSTLPTTTSTVHVTLCT